MRKRSLAAIAVAALVMGTALVLAPSTSSAEPTRPRVETHVVTEAQPAGVLSPTSAELPAVQGQQYPPSQYFFSFRLSLNLLFLRLEIVIELGSFLRNSRVVVESRRLGVRDVVTAGADGTAVLDAAIPDNAKPGRYTMTATGQSENGPVRVSSVVDVPSKAERAETAAAVLERPLTAAGVTALGQGVTLPASTSTEAAAPAATGAETETAAPAAAGSTEAAEVAEAAAPAASGGVASAEEVALPAESAGAVEEVAVPAGVASNEAVAGASNETAGAKADDLPRTGAGGSTQVAARIGALLLAFGGLLLLAARRRRAQPLHGQGR
jgi:hypothetical protein